MIDDDDVPERSLWSHKLSNDVEGHEMISKWYNT